MASTRHRICSRKFPAALFLIAALLCPAARASAQEKNKDKKPEKEKKEKVDLWVEIRTAHFIVASDGGEKTARRIADEFESLLHVFQTTMPNAHISTGIPVRIFAAKDAQSFARMAPEFPYDKRHDQPAGTDRFPARRKLILACAPIPEAIFPTRIFFKLTRATS